MELKFYYSFRDFQDNYNADFENWQKEQAESNEVNFLNRALYTAGHVGYNHFDNEEMKYSVVDMAIGADGITYKYDIENYASIVIGNIHNNVSKKFNLRNPNELGEFLFDFKGNFYDYIDDRRFDVRFFEAKILIPFFTLQQFTPKYRAAYNDKGEYVRDENAEVMEESGSFKEGVIFFDYKKYEEFLDEVAKIIQFIQSKIQSNTPKQGKVKHRLTNPKKLALLQELGFFDLPLFKNLTETKINEITGLILDADPKEFVYKNRLNLKSKDPNYQTDKYTAFQYLEEMKRLISTTN